MANHWTRTQWDLFDKPPPSMKLEATERVKAMEQLQVLLMEVITTLGSRRGADDDQD
jgi:hypothetical protein